MKAKPATSNSTSAAAKQNTIRQAMRLRRRSMSRAEKHCAAQSASRQLNTMPGFHRAQSIALYFAANGELDPHFLLRQLMARNKRVFVPVLPSMGHPRLWFVAVTASTRFARNRFGILEPKHGRRERMKPKQLDLVFVPLTAFDTAGNRIGMGGGYYDRSFAFRRHTPRCRKPKLIGLAYDWQKLAHIETNPWDVPLDGVLTDQRYYTNTGAIHCAPTTTRETKRT